MLIVLTALILRIAPACVAASCTCQGFQYTGSHSITCDHWAWTMCGAYVAHEFLSPLLQQPLAVSRLLR